MLLKSKIKTLVANGYYYGWKSYQKRRGNRVLLYHAVGSKLAHDSYGISISRELFKAQLDFLKENKVAVRPLFSLQQEPSLADEASLSLCFDDGYEDNLFAAELLSAQGIPFTIFVVSGFTGKRHYLQAHHLRDLSAMPTCQIGSHTVSHPRLAQLSEKCQEGELAGSKKQLEDVIGLPVSILSYPHGSFTALTQALASKVGYRFAYCSIPGDNDLAKLDAFALRRTEIVASDHLPLFAKKIGGAFDYTRLWQRVFDPPQR